MGGTCDRIFKNAGLGRKKAGDKINLIPLGGNDYPSRVQIDLIKDFANRLNPSYGFLRFINQHIIP